MRRILSDEDACHAGKCARPTEVRSETRIDVVYEVAA